MSGFANNWGLFPARLCIRLQHKKSLLDFRGHKCCNFDFNFTNFTMTFFSWPIVPVFVCQCFGPLAAVESKHKLVLNYAGTEKQSRIERYRCHIREVSVSLWFPPIRLTSWRCSRLCKKDYRLFFIFFFRFCYERTQKKKKENRSKQLKIAVQDPLARSFPFGTHRASRAIHTFIVFGLQAHN